MNILKQCWGQSGRKKMAENCEESDVYATMFNKLACHSFMNANQTLDSFTAVSQYGTSPQNPVPKDAKRARWHWFMTVCYQLGNLIFYNGQQACLTFAPEDDTFFIILDRKLSHLLRVCGSLGGRRGNYLFFKAVCSMNIFDRTVQKTHTGCSVTVPTRYAEMWEQWKIIC